MGAYEAEKVFERLATQLDDRLRRLEEILLRAEQTIKASSGIPLVDALQRAGRPAALPVDEPAPGLQTFAEAERSALLAALEANQWRQKGAAVALGVTARTVNYKIRKLGITHPSWSANHGLKTTGEE